MKNIILVAAMLIGAAAFASPTLSVSPTSPVVITGDYTIPDGSGRVVNAPWFQATYTITTDQPITLTSLYIQTWDNLDESNMSYTIHLKQPVEVVPGTPYSIDVYTDSLAPNDGYVYDVLVKFNGWYGTTAAPTARLVLTKTFKTQ